MILSQALAEVKTSVVWWLQKGRSCSLPCVPQYRNVYQLQTGKVYDWEKVNKRDTCIERTTEIEKTLSSVPSEYVVRQDLKILELHTCYLFCVMLFTSHHSLIALNTNIFLIIYVWFETLMGC